jgi:cytochrome oxidase Cu insertion factor (SCO1/SenC/PrrC family)
MQKHKQFIVLFALAVLVISITNCSEKGKKEGVAAMSDKTEQTSEGLKVGQTAPDFKAEATDGGEISLSELKGSWVILFFYPKAFTSG